MDNGRPPDWNDLQILLGVLRSGSLTKAAAELGLSQPTLSRRIAALEKQFGAALFHRAAPGLEPTELARRLGSLLSPLDDAAAKISRAVEESKERQKRLRLTTTSTLSLFLTENIRQLSPAADGTVLDITATRRTADFSLKEADMAIRVRRMPVAGPVIARKLGTQNFAVYVARTLVPPPRRGLPCIGLSNDRPPPQTPWFDSYVEDTGGRMVARLGEVHLRLTAVKAGGGASLLPCLLGDRESSLARLTPPVPELAEEIFLLTHSDVARRPATRDISARIVRLFKENAARISGSLVIQK